MSSKSRTILDSPGFSGVFELQKIYWFALYIDKVYQNVFYPVKRVKQWKSSYHKSCNFNGINCAPVKIEIAEKQIGMNPENHDTNRTKIQIRQLRNRIKKFVTFSTKSRNGIQLQSSNIQKDFQLLKVLIFFEIVCHAKYTLDTHLKISANFPFWFWWLKCSLILPASLHY